jgi:PAS domain S-box-containing protein
MKSSSIRPWFTALNVSWTILIIVMGISQYMSVRRIMVDMAENEARTLVAKDLQYRLWAARHGGVYAPVTAANQPNEYLHVPERDIDTPSGRHLTLINPAYMNRQVFDQSPAIDGVKSKITSEKYLRVANAPDTWEIKALRQLNGIVDEYSEVTQINEKPYFRFMKRLVTDEACLKCHAAQGYKRGDVRGGISLAVNMETWYRKASDYSHFLFITYLLIWAIGILGLLWGYRSMMGRRNERRIAERSLFESRERFRITFERAGVGIVHVSMDNRFVEVNKVFATMLKYESDELIGKSFTEITHPEDLQGNLDYLAAVACGEIQNRNYEKRYIAKDGTEVLASVITSVVCDENQKPLYFIGIVQDISTSRKIELELARNQKMESLGVLAGGVAHDFNNLLTIILGYMDLISMKCGDGEKFKDMFVAIKGAIERATHLSRQLLAFSRGGEMQKKIFDINDIVRESVKLALSGKSIEGKINLELHPKMIEADENQISQVLMNLIINACQAMNNVGVLKITTKNIFLKNEPTLMAGEYVIVKIKDSGSGISQTNLDKIFDPFFSTKENGRGLGLATVYSIVRRHGGKITVWSKVGVGTTFTVFLPATRKLAQISQSTKSDADIRSLKVLVMDDESVIGSMTVSMLESLGHHAVAVLDGKKAIDAYVNSMVNNEKFDLVIMDLTVTGGMGGIQAIKELLKIDPSVISIVASGYGNDSAMAECESYGFKIALPKPYKIADLKKSIESLFG